MCGRISLPCRGCSRRRTSRTAPKPRPRKRLQKAREDQAPVSREATNLAVLSVVALVLLMAASARSQRQLATAGALLLAQADRLDPAEALRMAAEATSLVGGAGGAGRAGGGAPRCCCRPASWSGCTPPRPTPSRLDPRRGLKRIFSATALIESGKSVAKLAVVGWAGWQAVGSSALPRLRQAMGWDAGMLADHAMHGT